MGDESTRTPITCRLAKPGDTVPLSQLAFASKAYWGYDDQFMDACREELTVSWERMAQGLFVVAETQTKILGFYGLDRDDDETYDLAFFFVSPEAIGTGLGKRLFQDMMQRATACQVKQILIEADPNAAAFYERMGSTKIGDVPSESISGRTLPHYRVTLKERDGSSD